MAEENHCCEGEHSQRQLEESRLSMAVQGVEGSERDEERRGEREREGTRSQDGD